MMWDLPTSLEIQGTNYEIRSDYRAVLDICTALSDPELNEQDRVYTTLDIFYPAFSDDVSPMPSSDYKEALEKCFWFINGGEEEKRKEQRPLKLVDWEKDYPYIIAPINRVCGQEIRSLPYLHWWTFLAAYNEIGGDCTFAQIVRIREKRARHKKMDKADREWYQKHRDLVDFETKYTDAEEELLKQWSGG